MALAFSCGFTGRVLFKPRIVQASYSSGKSSKIPSLMRYIPKKSRKSENQKLESVHFPPHRAENSTVFHQEQNPEFEDDEQEVSKSSSFHDRRVQKRGNVDISLLKLVPASQIIRQSKENEVVKSFDETQSFTGPVEAGERIQTTRQLSSSRFGSGLESTTSAGMIETSISKKLGSEDSSDELPVEPKNEVEAPEATTSRAPAQKKPFTMEEFAAFVSKQTRVEPEEEDDEEFEASEDGFDEEELGETFLTPSNNPGEKSAARNYAVFLLSRWQRTAAELRKKMSERNYSPQVIESTLTELKKDGLQSDTSYSEVFVQSRWSSRGWGPKRIRFELLKKGVDVSSVDKAIHQVFHSRKEDASETEEGQKWGMSREAAEHLIKLSARKWSSGGNIPVEVRNRRLGAWLQRRGFGWKVIKGVTDCFQERQHCSETQLVEDFEDV